jgi:hypothetical protein
MSVQTGRRIRRRLAALLFSIPLAAACNDDPTPPAPLVVGSMSAVSRTTFEGPAGEALGEAVVVQVTSTTGEAMPGQAVTFTTEGGGEAIPSGAITDAAGRAATSWILGTVAGANTLTARVEGAAPVTFSATGRAGAASQMVYAAAGEPQTAVAGTAVATRPAARVTDRHGNPIGGQTVTFAVTGGGGTITGPNAVATDGQGIATIGGWTLGSALGTNTLTALHPSTPPLVFIASGVTGPPASVTAQAGMNQTVTVMGAVPVPPQVLVRDAQGNPVQGADVTFAVATGGGTVSGAAQTTNVQGIATVGTWILGPTVGQQTLSATVGNLQPVFFAATAGAGSPASMTRLESPAQTADVNTAVAVRPAVIVRDAWDNPVRGANVTFTVTSGGGTATGVQQVTDSLGVARVGSWTTGSVEGVNTLAASAPGLGFVTFTTTTVNPALQRARQMLQNLRMINYSPVDAGWEDMWLMWQPGQLAQDFARIRDLGFNTVRLSVSVRAFGFPGLYPTLQPRLEQAIAIAHNAGLRVQLTLFEGLRDLQYIQFGRDWASAVLAPYRNDPRIAYIDVSPGVEPGNVQTRDWLRAIVPHVKSLAGDIPVTASFRTTYGTAAQIQALRTAGVGVDFFDIHYYGWADMAMHHLRAAQNAAGTTPIYVSRAGWPTGIDLEGEYLLPGVAGSEEAREAIQDQYYRILYRTTRTLNMPNPAPWMFADVSIEGVPETLPGDREFERTMGILREDYSLKPAAVTIRAINNGAEISTSFNSSFEFADAFGVPTVWRTDGPALFMRDDTTSTHGSASGRLSWSGFTSEPTVPAIYTTPITLPVPGSTYQLSAKVRGENIHSDVRIMLEWLSVEDFVIATSSHLQQFVASTEWTLASVTGTMPASAASVRIRFELPQNFGGTLWVDDVRFQQ